MKVEAIGDLVGKTPLVRYPSTSSELAIYIKLEGANPTGSIKDRACFRMITDALQRRTLNASVELLDASSGNFACAMAFHAARLGLRSTVVVSSKLTPEKRAYLSYLGATMVEHGNFTIEGNRLCRDLLHKEPTRYCFLDQLHNPCNPLAHFEETGPEIIADLPNVAMIVGSLGSGGTMSGLARYFKGKAPAVQMVSVVCAQGAKLPGVGSFADGDYVTPFIAEAQAANHFDLQVDITEAEASRAAQELNRAGFFIGLQTGAVLAAARRAASTLSISGPVVVISGDTGWKNLVKLGQSMGD